MPGVCSAVYGAVQYEEPLKSFAMSKAWSICGDIAIIVQKAT